jgi:hypothetical protein
VDGWVVIDTPLAPQALAVFCRDLERLYRINPYLEFHAWVNAGDDQIQRRTQGYTVPESWTHGSAEMRTRWLRRGMQTGDIEQCDTFAADVSP